MRKWGPIMFRNLHLFITLTGKVEFQSNSTGQEKPKEKQVEKYNVCSWLHFGPAVCSVPFGSDS